MSIVSAPLAVPSLSDVSLASPVRSRLLDLQGRAILLASDGSPGALAAGHIALALATLCDAVVHVVSVVDTRSTPIPPPLDLARAMDDALDSGGLHRQLVEEVRSALAAATAQPIDWPVRVVHGTPGTAIAREAERVGAALIVVGLRRHGRFDRVMNDETTLNVMRDASCPVLGVIPGTTALPSRVLAAVDFSEESLQAARTARALVSEDAVMVLAYVPPVADAPHDDGARAVHALGVEAAFARTVGEFGADGITFDYVVLHHALPRTPAEMLVECAAGMGCDLITAGSAHHSRVDRFLLGSVSTDLVRDGGTSVLVVPPQRVRSE